MLIIPIIIHVSTIPLGYIRHDGDIRRYLILKRILKNGCTCGSSVFEVYNDVICSKCGKIHYKYKRESNSITTQDMSFTYLRSKRKSKLELNFTTDVPIEDLFDFMSKPVPKDFRKYTSIKNIQTVSDFKWHIEYKSFLKAEEEIIEKKFPEFIISRVEFSNGLIVNEITEFRSFEKYIEVNIKATYSKRVAELVEKKTIKRNIENIIGYFSKKYHENYEVAFRYDKEPITH
jgi:hypothetical protein